MAFLLVGVFVAVSPSFPRGTGQQDPGRRGGAGARSPTSPGRSAQRTVPGAGGSAPGTVAAVSLERSTPARWSEFGLRVAQGGLVRAGSRGDGHARVDHQPDRKSTRLNSSHVKISYAVFCLKKK